MRAGVITKHMGVTFYPITQLGVRTGWKNHESRVIPMYFCIYMLEHFVFWEVGEYLTRAKDGF